MDTESNQFCLAGKKKKALGLTKADTATALRVALQAEATLSAAAGGTHHEC